MDEKGNLELLNTIETMEDILDSAMRIPLSNGRCVIDAERFSGITKRYAAESADRAQASKKFAE